MGVGGCEPANWACGVPGRRADSVNQGTQAVLARVQVSAERPLGNAGWDRYIHF